MPSNILDKDIYFEWKHIVRMIQKYNNLKIKYQLEIYHSEIESIYDIILDKQSKAFDIIITGLPNSFNNFFGHFYNKFNKENKALKLNLNKDENFDKITRLTRVNNMLQNQFYRLLIQHLDQDNVHCFINNAIRSINNQTNFVDKFKDIDLDYD